MANNKIAGKEVITTYIRQELNKVHIEEHFVQAGCYGTAKDSQFWDIIFFSPNGQNYVFRSLVSKQDALAKAREAGFLKGPDEKVKEVQIAT